MAPAVKLAVVAMVAAISLLGSQSAQAADAAWNVNADGAWATDSNWNPATAPGSTSSTTNTDTATFETIVPSGTTRTITVDANRNILGISFDGNSGAYILNGGSLILSNSGLIQTNGVGSIHTDTISTPITLAGDATFATNSTTTGRILAFTSTATITGSSTQNSVLTLDGTGTSANNAIAGIIANGSGFTAAITKNGAGNWTLSGANTYSGGTTLNAGTINFSNNTAFGTGTITSNSGVIKATAGVTTTNNLVVNGATTLDVSGGNWNLNGNIGGNGAITRGTAATLSLYLGGDNSGYTGTFTVQNNGNAVVRFNSTTSGSANASWVFANTTTGRTTLSWAGTGTISFGSMTGAGQIQTDIAGAKIISAGALGLNDLFLGTIANGTGTIALTKVGNGALTLSGANTFSGSTMVSAGILVLGNNLAIQNSALDTSGAGTVTLTGFTTPTIGGLSGSTDLSSVITAGYSGVTGLTLNPQAGVTISYSGLIANGASGMTLTKSGAGTQALAGANSYSGMTSISAGILQISAANNLGDGSATNTLAFNGGTLQSTANSYDLGTNRTIGLAGAGTIQSDAGTLTVSGGISASSTGNKILTVQGAGSTAITGAITAGSGGIGLNKRDAGTLTLSGGAALAAGVIGNGGANHSAVILGGTTKISNGTYTSAGEFVVGGILANGGAGVNTNLTMDGGTLTGSGYLSLGRGNGVGAVSSDIVLNNSATITAANFSAGFNGGNGANLPKGTFTLNSSSSFTISGNGVFNLAESTGSDMGITLNGSSQLVASGTGAKTIGNFGTGVLTLNGTSSVSFGNQVIHIGGASNNNATAFAAASGTLNVNSGTTFTTSSEIRIASGSNVDSTATGTVNVSGGTLNANALTLLRSNANVATHLTANLVVTSNGIVNITGGNTLVGWQGGGSTGTISLASGAFNQGTTATTNIDLGVNGNASGVVNVGGGAMTLQRNSSIRFATNAGNSGTNSLTISGGSVTFYSDAGTTVGGTGVIDLMNTAATLATNTLNLNGGTLTANQLKATSASGNRVINFNGGTLKSGASALAPTFLASGVATTANVRNYGAIIDTSGNNVSIGQALTHSVIGGDNATDGGLTKLNTGALTLTGANTYTGATTIQAGTLVLAAASNNIASSSKILVGDTFAHNTAGLNVSGVTGGFSLGSTQTLAGYGTVTGNVTGVYGSSVAPGGSIGKLTINGNLTLGQGTLVTELDKSTPNSLVAGTDYDQLVVTSGNSVNVTDGTLALELGNNLVNGDVFYVLDNQGSNGVTGTFAGATINGVTATGTFANGDTFSAVLGSSTYSFTINYDATASGTANDIALTAVSVPEPGMSLPLLGLGAWGLMSRRRKSAVRTGH
jgi:autotransporter-associated beta strand protein